MQACPICTQETRANPRYPRYLCIGCISDGVTVEGQLVPLIDLELWKSDPVRCEVSGVACVASEAHLGGSVVLLAEDVHSGPSER